MAISIHWLFCTRGGWAVLGTAYAVVLLFVYALCVAAGRADDAMEALHGR